MVRRTIKKEVIWQIGEDQYSNFVEFLGQKYEVTQKNRTPRTSTLEAFYAAGSDDELVRLMMEEYLSNDLVA